YRRSRRRLLVTEMERRGYPACCLSRPIRSSWPIEQMSCLRCAARFRFSASSWLPLAGAEVMPSQAKMSTRPEIALTALAPARSSADLTSSRLRPPCAPLTTIVLPANGPAGVSVLNQDGAGAVSAASALDQLVRQPPSGRETSSGAPIVAG